LIVYFKVLNTETILQESKGDHKELKKAFTLVAVLFMVSILMAGVPVAVASGNEFSGIMYLIPDQDKPGQTYYTDSGFVVTIGAGVYGPIWTSDPRTSGTMFINLNVVVNMDTGKGFGFGAFQLASDLGSTFRGTFG